METFKSHSGIETGNQGKRQNRKSCRNFFIAALIMCCLHSTAGNNTQVITIAGTQFTYPLIQKWITEYARVNPELKFKLINDQDNTDKADIKIIAHTPEKGELAENKSLINVGRLAILPIINENNPLFSKEVKKGIKRDGLRAIFMKDDTDLNSGEEKSKEPEYTVYTKTPQSCSAKVISSYLGHPSDDLKGIFVTGDDSYLISSLLEDSTGVSYNNLGLIYDLKNRFPVHGIKVLPIDLNNNGRLDKEEQLYSNLDEVISFLELSKNTSIPTDNVSFVVDSKSVNPEISNFINWVKASGQEFNHQFGFLNNSSFKNSPLTQK